MFAKPNIFLPTLLAAFALSAVAASVASAQTPNQLHSGSGSGTTYLTAHGINGVLHTGGAGNIKCATFSGKGSYAGTTAGTATLEDVTYSGCTAFGLTMHFDMMGCDYLVTDNTATTGIVHIVCPTTAGGVKDEITVTPTQGGVPVCHIDIPEQTVDINIAQDAGPPDHLTITPTAAETLTYTSTYIPADHAKTKCGTQGTHHDGKLTGAITVKASSNALHVNQVSLTYP